MDDARLSISLGNKRITDVSLRWLTREQQASRASPWVGNSGSAGCHQERVEAGPRPSGGRLRRASHLPRRREARAATFLQLIAQPRSMIDSGRINADGGGRLPLTHADLYRVGDAEESRSSCGTSPPDAKSSSPGSDPRPKDPSTRRAARASELRFRAWASSGGLASASPAAGCPGGCGFCGPGCPAWRRSSQTARLRGR